MQRFHFEAIGFSILGYLPWLIVFMQQVLRVKEDYWMPEVNEEMVYDSWLPYPFISEPSIVFQILQYLFIILMLYMLIRSIVCKKERHWYMIPFLLGTLYYAVVIIATILSITMQPIFQAKYAFPCIALLWLGVLLSIKYIKGKAVIITILVACMIYSNIKPHYDEYRKVFRTEEDIIIEYVNENVDYDTYFLSDIGHWYWVLPAYFPNHNFCAISDFWDYNIAEIPTLDAEEVENITHAVYLSLDSDFIDKQEIFSDEYEILEVLQARCSVGMEYLYEIKKSNKY